ncbi:hypothetical protein TREMEDRAFT_73172 [Tremella mesenterica DSM 1558]|uniref:uncharacterized protein n=1 Tax=Tremella mesenterica (strain ATCC 24925 / CBS 8224 / DSM 1558 / NBRC 9311 / NRRL Y-6157 / RJB 2259-6 / UBC 559-6) TaxID=578456 RepID=UPI0003F49A02|nr:uncharacterized protein TREMEDRAFT_73172 [Tremella mesenterica DSM 1558]EIW71052.1 hypothetical protein TREMEDRAFT_73172 [Tremella mesenterica DSM 1558]
MSTFHTAVTTITQNIPLFIRQPAEALIGQRCYSILVYDFDITHVECLKYALSKGLGLGIVLGGAIVKIPQIITIVSTSSARGLSLSAYILETASYAISLAYASRAAFPFSTYGENFFLTIQNVIITLLILYFSPSKGVANSPKRPLNHTRPRGGLRRVFPGAVVAAVLGLFLWSEQLCPAPLLSLLQAATLPLSLLSKAPQIMSNHAARSTGNLSAFAVFNALLGCLARLFTTYQEIDDPLVFWGFLSAAILNLVLATQMIMYGSKGEGLISTNKEGDGVGSRTSVEEHVLEAPGIGRVWARKLD